MVLTEIQANAGGYRVKPMRDGNQALLQDFDDYFANTIAEIFPLTRTLLTLPPKFARNTTSRL